MPRAEPTAKRPRKLPTQARAQATVEAILEGTAQLLAAHGYDALSTNRVALQAGVSIGSLYQYFPSKEALVGELMDRHCDRLNALFGAVFMHAQELSPKDLARAVVSAIYRAKCENPQLSRVLHEQLPRLGRTSRLAESLEQTTRLVAGYLARHRRLLRVKCPERAAFYAVELGQSLTIASILKRPDSDPETDIDEITDIVVRYVFADAS